jgi:hypothetical protein
MDAGPITWVNAKKLAAHLHAAVDFDNRSVLPFHQPLLSTRRAPN